MKIIIPPTTIMTPPAVSPAVSFLTLANSSSFLHKAKVPHNRLSYLPSFFTVIKNYYKL